MAVTRQQVSQLDFIELANNILHSMVSQVGGSFDTVVGKFTTYLDQTGVDVIQKQAAVAQFTKEIYSDINKQALTSAMDLLKSNAQLDYEKWKVEADYSLTMAQANKMTEEQGLVALTKTKMEKENELLEKSKLMADANYVEQMAKLKKQYGVVATTTATLGSQADVAAGFKYAAHTYLSGSVTVSKFFRVNDYGEFLMSQTEAAGKSDEYKLYNSMYYKKETVGAGVTAYAMGARYAAEHMYKKFTNGIYYKLRAQGKYMLATAQSSVIYTDGNYYKTNTAGQFVNTSDVVITNPLTEAGVLATTTTPDTDGVTKVITDPSVEGEIAITSTPQLDGIAGLVSASTLTYDINNTSTPGAIDKQIAGYDYVNYKDVLKTMDERAALMQNAKVPESASEKLVRAALIRELTTTISDMPSL